MDLIRKIKLTTYRVKKYFKNSKFRKEIKKEKSKKYLFAAQKNKKANLIDFYKSKKRFSQFIVTVSSRTNEYRYYYI